MKLHPSFLKYDSAPVYPVLETELGFTLLPRRTKWQRIKPEPVLIDLHSHSVTHNTEVQDVICLQKAECSESPDVMWGIFLRNEKEIGYILSKKNPASIFRALQNTNDWNFKFQVSYLTWTSFLFSFLRQGQSLCRPGWCGTQRCA